MPRRCLLPPWRHTHTQNAGTLLLVGRYGSLHKVVGRRCLKCQARKTSRLTVRWPTLTIQLPNGPGISVSVDYFGPLPITARGNSYILLFTDRFSRRADMFAVTAAEYTAEGTANILVNRFIPLWGCPSICYQTTDFSSAHNSRQPSINLWVYRSSQQAPTTQAETAV